MANSGDRKSISDALARVRAPVFVARQTQPKGRPLITLHTTERRAARTIVRQAQAALSAEGTDVSCRVVVHRPAVLNRVRSLEGLLKRLGDGDIVFDPTEVIGRSLLICDFAARLRRALPGVVENLFVDAGRRTLFVIVDRGHYPTSAEERLAARVQTLDQVAVAFAEWCATNRPDFDLAIRVGFEPPAGAGLIAIDRATAAKMLRELIKRRSIQAAIASLLGLATIVPAAAADAIPPPAAMSTPSAYGLYEPSLTVVTRGALFDAAHFGNPSWGSVGLKGTMPLGDSFGLMGEASVGTNSYWGAAGHAYWRDPSKGLLGGFASYETDASGNRTRFGGEGHLYLNMWSLKGIAGYQQSSTEGNGFIGKLDLTFYATPNFSVTGGVGTDPVGGYGHAGFEWMPAMTGAHAMSVFLDGRFGTTAQNRLIGGLKFHFGGAGKTLIERQRMNSPDDALGSPIKKADYVAPPPG